MPHQEFTDINGRRVMNHDNKPTPASNKYWEREEETKRKLTRTGRIAMWAGGLTAGVLLAVGAHNAYKSAQDDELPQPKETGEIVKIYPQDGEGENELVNDLARPGFDSDKFRKTVEATETDTGGLQKGPIEVDIAYLTTDEKVLQQYGVQPQDTQSKQ